MKKNFFKKLSFVIALAMIISTIAPAAGAFAATSIKLNATKKYLHLGVDGSDDYNFNIVSKKGTGWKYSWESSNEDVAVVDEKNGVVTAAGVGTAKVTVSIVDKDGEEVGSKTATVVVRDNIKTVTITGKPANDKASVGVANDFNRSFVTVSGSTKVTSAITRWSVSPATGATIDAKGVFTATAAGEYTVTAMSFQSVEKYNAYVKDPVANAAYLLDDDTYKFTVAAAMTGAKQKDLDTVNVTFNAAMVDVDKNIAVYQIVGETPVKQAVAKVEMDTDKKVASVSLYVPFVTGATYKVEYTGMDSVSFKAATTEPEDVTSMTIETKEAVINTETDVDVKLFNAEGVEITTPTLLTRVTMSAAGELGTYFNEAAQTVLIFTKGTTTAVKAVYHTYKYNTTDGAEVGNVEAAGVITGVDAAATNLTGLAAWTIVDSGDQPDFDKPVQVIAADDTNGQLHVKINTLTGTTKDDVNSYDEAGDFEFTTSDDSVLIIDPTTGNLFPLKQGTAVVVVKYATGTATKVPVATVTVTVGAKAAATNFTLSASQFNLSNAAGLGDSKDVKLTLKDQFTRGFEFTNVKIDRISAPIVGGVATTDNIVFLSDGTTPALISDNTVAADDEYTLVFNGEGVDAGTYVYKITVENISRVVTVTVKAPNGVASYYVLELESTTVDMKVDTNTTFPVNVNIHVYGYASNGVRVSDETLDSVAGDYYVVVDAPNDPNGNFTDDTNNSGAYAVVDAVAGEIVKAPIGSYKVTAFRTLDDKAIGTAYFTTTDTQVKAVVNEIDTRAFETVVTSIASGSASLIAAVDECFDFTINGTPVVAADIIAVEATGTFTSIAIKSVTVLEHIGGNTLEHKITVGLTINQK